MIFHNKPDQMQKICGRLQTCLKAALPELSLNPGATEAQILQAEAELQVTLPADLKDFYRVHNGQETDAEGIIFCCGLLSLEEIVKQWKMWQEVAEGFADDNQDKGLYSSTPAGHIKSQYINAKWIPFTHDWGGNHIGVDLDPGSKGTSGQVICFGRDEDDKYVLGKSFKEFIDGLVKAFERGQFVVTENRSLDMDAYYQQLRARAKGPRWIF